MYESLKDTLHPPLHPQANSNFQRLNMPGLHPGVGFLQYILHSLRCLRGVLVHAFGVHVHQRGTPRQPRSAERPEGCQGWGVRVLLEVHFVRGCGGALGQHGEEGRAEAVVAEVCDPEHAAEDGVEVEGPNGFWDQTGSEGHY